MTLEAVPTEADEQSLEAAIGDAFEVSVAKEEDEDTILLGMINAGATFKNVKRLYNQLMIENGYAISRTDRDTIVNDKCSEMDLEDGDTFQTIAQELVNAIPDTTDRSAYALIRGYAKRNDLKTWTPPKPEKSGGHGFGNKFKEYILTTIRETGAVPSKEAVLDMVHGRNGNEETTTNIKNSASSYLGVWKFASSLLEAKAEQ